MMHIVDETEEKLQENIFKDIESYKAAQDPNYLCDINCAINMRLQRLIGLVWLRGYSAGIENAHTIPYREIPG